MGQSNGVSYYRGKLNERDSLSIDSEMYIENHNNVLFQGGYSRPMGH